jgi:hypothetical protein
MVGKGRKEVLENVVGEGVEDIEMKLLPTSGWKITTKAKDQKANVEEGFIMPHLPFFVIYSYVVSCKHTESAITWCCPLDLMLTDPIPSWTQYT